jgi:hypothetical protein
MLARISLRILSTDWQPADLFILTVWPRKPSCQELANESQGPVSRDLSQAGHFFIDFQEACGVAGD